MPLEEKDIYSQMIWDKMIRKDKAILSQLQQVIHWVVLQLWHLMDPIRALESFLEGEVLWVGKNNKDSRSNKDQTRSQILI